MRFLFWNINRKPLQSFIATIVKERDVDVVVLAENRIPLVPLLLALNNTSVGTYTLSYSPSERIQVFSRLPEGSILPLKDHVGVSIRHLIPPIGRDLLLVAAHLPSKFHDEEADQFSLCARIRGWVEEHEKLVGHTRTMIIGDLNLNPFEPGAVSADAIHGVMSRRIAQRGSRTVDGEERRFFYNPMWARYRTVKPPPITFPSSAI